MKRKQIKRKLEANKGEVTLTWIFEDSEQRLFSASEHFSDGHGANFSILRFPFLKDKSLKVEMSITGKGGRTTSESCTLDKESIVKLIEILQSQIDKMTPFERENDVIVND